MAIKKMNSDGTFSITHAGLVVRTYERNGREDSDFFAVVYVPERDCFDHIMFATTRAWTYENSAVVDATPDVLAAVERHRLADARRTAELRAAHEAATPVKGRTVIVERTVNSKKQGKIEAGATGEIFWIGDQGYQSRYRALVGLMEDPRKGKRLGVRLDDGRSVFINAEAAKVLA